MGCGGWRSTQTRNKGGRGQMGGGRARAGACARACVAGIVSMLTGLHAAKVCVCECAAGSPGLQLGHYKPSYSARLDKKYVYGCGAVWG